MKRVLPVTAEEIEARIADAAQEREFAAPLTWQPWRNSALDRPGSGRVRRERVKALLRERVE